MDHLSGKRVIISILGILFLVSLLIVAWIEGGKQRFDPEPNPVLSGDSQSCYKCHLEKTPVISQQWADSTHAKRGVGCFECHQAEEGDADAWVHEGKLIATITTPKDCARCHQGVAKEFMESHHAKAGKILGSLDNVLGETIEGVSAAVNGCQQCHGSTVALLKDEHGKVKKDKNGKPQLDPSTWPNTGIGRINLDGSNGSCTACHSRHLFSKKVARFPDTCGKCHMGPDHPQIEIYNESKHGIAFRANIGEMNLDSDKWVVGQDYSAAPTCTTCHMSATPNQKVTHDPGKRISWTLRPIVSKKLKNWEKKRANMQDACQQCHSPDFVGAFYKQYDEAVELYNGKYAIPSKKIMAALKEQKLITTDPFDDKIEWTFFELWHHEGRRARMGASMMGPDYTQWHGFYEVAKHFYTKFIPEAKELAKSNSAAMKVIEDVMDMPEHKWKKGLSKEERDKIKAFYQKRYGK
jgi:hydroxylamine dehydrogenase